MGLRNQKTLLWCRSRFEDDKYGTRFFVIVPVFTRWEEKREIYIDEFGETKVSKSIAYFGDKLGVFAKNVGDNPGGDDRGDGNQHYISSVSGGVYSISPGDYMAISRPGTTDDDYDYGYRLGDQPPQPSVRNDASMIRSVSVIPNLDGTKRIIKVWL